MTGVNHVAGPRRQRPLLQVVQGVQRTAHLVVVASAGPQPLGAHGPRLPAGPRHRELVQRRGVAVAGLGEDPAEVGYIEVGAGHEQAGGEHPRQGLSHRQMHEDMGEDAIGGGPLFQGGNQGELDGVYRGRGADLQHIGQDAGGPLAKQLAALYDYASLRLLQANLKNDHAALDEVGRMLADLRDAWAQIGARAPVAKSEAAAAPPAARFFDDPGAGPVRRVVVTA